MKSLTKSLLILCVAFMAFCSYFLYSELTERIDKTGGNAIGTITFKKRSASRRYSDNVIWEEIDQESEIFNYDAIRTMEYSSAVIALNDGTRIELEQNTLLVVILSEKGLNINFDKGGVSAKSGAGSQSSITLNAKDAVIALDKGDISVNSSDAGMKIQLNSGSAKVAADGKEMKILPDEIATLKDGIAESKKVSLYPVSPDKNSNFISYSKTRSISFNWRSEPTGEVRVEIADNGDFKNIIRSYTTRKTGIDAVLPPGDYYWRIVRGDAESNPVRFSILGDTKPVLTAPQNNQKLNLIDGAGMVAFRWEKSRYASAYELTAARDSNMSDVVLTLTSKINNISATGLKPGRYYWTVKGIYPPEVISASALSGPSLFELEKADFSRIKPVPLDQGPVTTAGPFNLNWKGIQGVKNYKIELSSDPEFKKNIMTDNTVNTFVRVNQKLAEGKYFWRVSAIFDKNNFATSTTAILSLIRPVEIVLLNPSPGDVLLDKPVTINLSWRDPNNGENYTVEISGSPDFRNIKFRRDADQSAIDIKSPGSGTYYWRVLLKEKTGSLVAQSGTGMFVIPGDLKIPVASAPGKNEKIIPGLKKRLRFEWSKIVGADEYEVEIFQHIAGMEKQLMIYSSRKNYIDIVNQTIFNPGNYSWLIRAKQIRKGHVAAYKESEKSYFRVEEVVLLPAPEVKNPGVIFK